MKKVKQFVKSELTGWKKFDIFWILFATAVILGLSLYWKEGALELIMALTGVWCVILTGKGKRSSFLLGTVNSVLYAIVAFSAKYYGEVMLNALYYVPMNVVGWFVWKKHMNDDTGEVIKKRLPIKKGLLVFVGTGLAIAGYGMILARMGGQLPYVDSMSTVVSVVAQVLSIWRLTEQWVLWIIVDIVTVIMWAVDFARGGETVATLAMWSIYLLNAVIMFIRWYRETEKNKAAESTEAAEPAE